MVGIGYMGFPLACAIDRAGFGVCGFDVALAKVVDLEVGRSYLGHMSDEPFTTL